MGERRRCWRDPGWEDRLWCVYFACSPFVLVKKIYYHDVFTGGAPWQELEKADLFVLLFLFFSPPYLLDARQPLPALGQYLITSVTEQHVVFLTCTNPTSLPLLACDGFLLPPPFMDQLIWKKKKKKTPQTSKIKLKFFFLRLCFGLSEMNWFVNSYHKDFF